MFIKQTRSHFAPFESILYVCVCSRLPASQAVGWGVPSGMAESALLYKLTYTYGSRFAILSLFIDINKLEL